MEDITQYFSLPLHVAAALHKMSISDFKRMYNEKGIKRWPYNKYKNQKKNMGGFEDFQIKKDFIIKQKPINPPECPVVLRKELSLDLDLDVFCTESPELFNLFDIDSLINGQYLQ
jgi:hypothetical protein